MWAKEVGMLMCAFLFSAAIIAYYVDKIVPDPYMDEIFHVPQTQKYCLGEWNSWDPKITTFPGLYVLGVAVSNSVAGISSYVVGHHVPALAGCTPLVLRSVNILLATLCVPVFYYLASSLDLQRSKSQLLLLTFICATFPVHYFFTYLYYTDVGSTFFTLSTWLASRRSHFKIAGILGAGAVLMRQTNAVWVTLIAAHSALQMCSDPHSKPSSRDATREFAQWTATSVEILQVVKRAWALKWTLLARLWPMMGVVVAFAVFVVQNGGVVVGDKENHTPVRHFMQPFYCALFCTISLAPIFCNPWAIVKHFIIGRKLNTYPILKTSIAIGFAAAVLCAVMHGTLVHPFLLADNRHYTFYLWRRIFNARPWSRFALIPAYLYAVATLDTSLCQAGRSTLERVLLAATVATVLVPAHLIELRYFSMSFYAVALMGKSPAPRLLAVVAAAYTVCNAAVLYAFLARPFAWPDGSIARFLW